MSRAGRAGRRLGLTLVLAAWLCIGLACKPRPATEPESAATACLEALRGAPIILLVVDTLRADYLGSYGFQGDISPRLDALARQSVRFDNAIAQAPWTKPSIASLFTATSPGTHGVTDHQGHFWNDGSEEGQTGALNENLTTMAEGLGTAGYLTAAFVANPWLKPGFGFEQGFEVYDAGFADHTAPAKVVIDAASAWLAQIREESFFLYLHFMDVHGPYQAEETAVARVRGSPGLGADRELSDKEFRRILRYLQKPEWVSGPRGRSLAEWRARYAAGVVEFDRAIGPLLELMERSGVLDRSLLIVTSDHGEELAEHGRWDHGFNLFEHQIHVPLLVRLPAAAGGGRTVSDVVRLIDLLPTLIELAGAPVPEQNQGESLWPMLCGESPRAARYAVATATKKRPGLYAVRTASRKLISNLDGGATTLFDLRRIPPSASTWPKPSLKPCGDFSSTYGIICVLRSPPRSKAAVRRPSHPIWRNGCAPSAISNRRGAHSSNQLRPRSAR